MSNQLKAAETLARIAHDGQTRMDGVEPFINHPRRVVERLQRDPAATWPALVAGWLHDVVEDTVVTFQDLRDMGFEEKVIRIVTSLTKRENEVYRNYLKRVALDPEAVRVKLADLADNLASLPEGHGLHERYERALLELTGLKPSVVCLDGIDDEAKTEDLSNRQTVKG